MLNPVLPGPYKSVALLTLVNILVGWNGIVAMQQHEP